MARLKCQQCISVQLHHCFKYLSTAKVKSFLCCSGLSSDLPKVQQLGGSAWFSRGLSRACSRTQAGQCWVIIEAITTGPRSFRFEVLPAHAVAWGRWGLVPCLFGLAGDTLFWRPVSYPLLPELSFPELTPSLLSLSILKMGDMAYTMKQDCFVPSDSSSRQRPGIPFFSSRFLDGGTRRRSGEASFSFNGTLCQHVVAMIWKS